MDRTTIVEEQAAAAEERWVALWSAGPQRTRWEELPVQAGDPAPDLELLDSDGRTVRLSDLWAGGPAVLLFWRHYGCGCGFDRAERLRAEHDELVSLGATVVVIGQGEPERSALYKARTGLPCTVLCDPERVAYRAYGLLDGTPEQIVYGASAELLRGDVDAGLAFAAGRRETERRLVDSPWQMPGEFVIAPGGAIRLAYRYPYCEAFPDPTVIASAVALAIA